MPTITIQNNLFPIANYIEEDLYNDENYTPIDYLDFYRDFLGGYDLDAFSHPDANRNVKASTFWTKKDDAFLQDWEPYYKKFFNPPYSKGLIDRAVQWVLRYRHIGESLLLTNANTSSSWYQEALAMTHDRGAFCLTNRMEFYNAERERQIAEGVKKRTSNFKGQTLFYYGDRWQEFADISKSLGAVGRGIL